MQNLNNLLRRFDTSFLLEEKSGVLNGIIELLQHRSKEERDGLLEQTIGTLKKMKARGKSRGQGLNNRLSSLIN